jgi:hypothetical protein
MIPDSDVVHPADSFQDLPDAHAPGKNLTPTFQVH